MSPQFQKPQKAILPSMESSLDEKAKEALAEELGKAAVSSGATNLAPVGSVALERAGNEIASVAPPPTSAAAQQFAPILQMMDGEQNVLGSLPQDTPMDKAMVAGFMQMAANAKNAIGGNQPPIQTAAAKLVINGRSVYIPESVRDVPNTLITYKPAEALKYYMIFTSRLTDDESDALTELAARGNGKPLMWLSEKIYWLLAIQRELPQKDSTIEAFTPADADPKSQSFKLIMDTFGQDCGNQILVACERTNVSVLDLIKWVARRMLERYDMLVAQTAKVQTVNSWKRPRLSQSQSSQGSVAMPLPSSVGA